MEKGNGITIGKTINLDADNFTSFAHGILEKEDWPGWYGAGFIFGVDAVDGKLSSLQCIALAVVKAYDKDHDWGFKSFKKS